MNTMLEPQPVAYKGEEPAVAGYADVLALASVMLGYPDEPLCAQRSAVCAAVEGLPGSAAKKELLGFARWWTKADPRDLQKAYVETFDTQRGNTLYVTYCEHGDSRSRGGALFDLKQLFRTYGFEPTDEELPDYLPTICQFAALAPLVGALEALAAARTAVASIHASLVAQASPYAHVLAAIKAIIDKGVKPCGS